MFKGLSKIVTGLAAGLTLGVLFSPDKGKKTRDKLKKSFEKGGKEGFENLSKTAKDFATDVSNTVNDVAKDVSANEKVKKVKEQVSKTAKELKDDVVEAYEELTGKKKTEEPAKPKKAPAKNQPATKKASKKDEK